MSAAEVAALPRVLVVGSGAVGSFLGGMLAAAGHEVVLLDRRVLGGDDATRLRIEGPDGSQLVPVRRVVDAAEAGEPSCIVLGVKIFHLDGALETAARWPGATLLTVQNGVGAEALARSARHAPVLAGSLTTAVEPLPDGVKRTRTGGMGVAVVPGDGADAGGPVADLLAASWSARRPARPRVPRRRGDEVVEAARQPRGQRDQRHPGHGPRRHLRRPADVPRSSAVSSTRRSRS